MKSTEKWHVVRNGQIIKTGTEKQCVAYLVKHDKNGDMELYPESAMTENK